MSLILSIETATRTCSVALHREGVLLSLQEVHLEKSHSSLLHLMIDSVLAYAEVGRGELDGIAISMGPGSYTGLRIGASSAKGLCYALDIPLVGVGTLEAMAYGVDQYNAGGAWLCPMIDARRMEVFCRLQTSETFGNAHQGQELLPTQALVIDQHAFRDFLEPQGADHRSADHRNADHRGADHHEVWFFGNGSDKCRDVLGAYPSARFISGIYPSARWVGQIATAKFERQEFEDIAYSVPHYGKAFYTTQARSKKQSGR